MRLFAICVVAAAACHAPPPSTHDRIDAPGTGIDAAIDADIPAGWTMLISRQWTLAAGQQTYKCTRMQVATDMWINGFRSLQPIGTHHEVVTIDTNDTPVGDYDCNAGSGTLAGEMLYAAGVNTDDLVFPTGVAVHLAAGTWINLNLHLFDVSDNTESGMSGVLVKTIDPASVVNEADMTFSGTFNISIPADGQPHQAMGGCAPPVDWHVFALWPHMHQLGTHQTLTVTHGGVVTTELDQPYMFTEQRNYPMAETIFHAGDQILTTCTYVNNTGMLVSFGDSSTAEMCFTGLYKYPAGGNTFSCAM
jgi:hypothetical protein